MSPVRWFLPQLGSHHDRTAEERERARSCSPLDLSLLHRDLVIPQKGSTNLLRKMRGPGVLIIMGLSWQTLVIRVCPIRAFTSCSHLGWIQLTSLHFTQLLPRPGWPHHLRCLQGSLNVGALLLEDHLVLKSFRTL